MPTLTAKQNTLLKSHPIDSNSPDLPSDFKTVPLAKGQKVIYNWLKKKGSHYLLEAQVPIDGRFNWYVYGAHFDGSSPIDWNDPDQKISEYFTVGEVTKGDSRRIPTAGSPIEKNILALARELDKIRKDWGSPIVVTSWYRPPSVNAAIGGARNSQHLSGRAVDIRPQNGDLVRFERWLDENWFGALGYGARSGRGFTHLDMRNGKGWKAGGRTKGARWNY